MARPVLHTCSVMPPWETCPACEEELAWEEQHGEDEVGMPDGERRYLAEHEVIDRPPAFLCGGTASAADLQAVAAFGRFLEQAGPAPVLPKQTYTCDGCMAEVGRKDVADFADGVHILCKTCGQRRERGKA